ncbi:AAA family ATPase [Ideonella sp. BN130291]|uniref:AAA family ATPase n=1 Tax=Ideonella sp. BN130291 TaxID=3112940 RepID=UPI002E260868|nr:AAA family ATPase [Ideonella sp. BN130291]
MYASFFGLKQEPFSIAPDPRYLFMSERHREALAHLLYGVRGGGGFVLLSGEIGAGKTTVCRCFLEQLPKRCNVAYIFNPKLTVEELLRSVCDEFRIPYEHAGPGQPTVKDYVDALNDYLLRTHAVGQNNVLIIDEAQNLSADVLEQLRLLTNLETSERKLLQIVLIGQPELRSMLARPELEQLAQRVIARFHLDALSERETEQYIRHRLGVAGLGKALPFDRKAMQRIHRISRGVPRRINLLCDRALLGAYASGQPVVDRRIVDKAAAEVFDLGAAPALLPAHGSPLHGGGGPPARPGRSAALRLALGLVAGAGLFALAALTLDTGWRRGASTAPAGTARAHAASSTGADGAVVARARAAPAASTAVASTVVPMPPLADDAAVGWLASEKEAWRQLAAAWGLALGEGEPCQAAQRQQVQCFRSTAGSLALIHQLDRPGILTLHDDRAGAPRPAYALLLGFNAQGAVLRTADGPRTVSLGRLAQLWRGDFATFWRAPPTYPGKPAEAAGGALADWLAARLAQLPGEAGTAASGERPLGARIAAFQVAQGLKPDGLAGPITLMQLNRATGIDEPRLTSPR